MYNRYIPGSHREQRRQESGEKRERTGGLHDILTQLTAPLHLFGTEEQNAGIAGILSKLGLEGLDSGDILLLLIILLIFLEGDNTEAVIALGLLLLLGGKEGERS